MITFSRRMQSFITLRENKPKWFHTRINVSHTLSVTHTHSESTHYQSHTQTQDGRGTVSTRELRKICRVERRRVTRKEFRHQDHRSSRSPLVWLRCSRKVWLLNTTRNTSSQYGGVSTTSVTSKGVPAKHVSGRVYTVSTTSATFREFDLL